MDPLFRDKTWMQRAYDEWGFSIYDIAMVCGCDRKTVRLWMRKHGIKARSQEEAARILYYREYWDRDYLYQKYIIERLSVAKIAAFCDTSSSVISDWLHRHGIPTRPQGNHIGGGPPGIERGWAWLYRHGGRHRIPPDIKTKLKEYYA